MSTIDFDYNFLLELNCMHASPTNYDTYQNGIRVVYSKRSYLVCGANALADEG